MRTQSSNVRWDIPPDHALSRSSRTSPSGPRGPNRCSAFRNFQNLCRMMTSPSFCIVEVGLHSYTAYVFREKVTKLYSVRTPG